MPLSEFLSNLTADRVLAVYLTTSGPDAHTGRITAVQLAIDGSREVFAHEGELSPGDVTLLREAIMIPNMAVFHNAQTALSFLIPLNICPRAVFDLCLASQLLDFSVNPLNFDLPALAYRYLGIEPETLTRASNNSRPQNLARLANNSRPQDLTRPADSTAPQNLAGQEAGLLLSLCSVLNAKLQETGMMDIAEIEFNCTKAIAEMEYHGIHLDIDKWNALYQKTREQLNLAREKLYEFSGRPMVQLTLWGGEESLDINFDSNPYVLSLLNKHDIPVKSTGKRELYPYHSHPLVRALSEYRKQSKLISAFLQPIRDMLHPVTGRLHPHYGQLSACSGRMSCWNPNIQQIPRESAFRECFTAPAGTLLLIADYSQIELRVAAQISRDPRMLAAYQKGEDLHALTASILTGKPADQITGPERQAAKPVNFGLIFGMGPRGLIDSAQLTYGVEMSLEQATDFSKRFFAAYQGISNWHSWLKSHPEKEGRTLIGRRFCYSGQAPLPEVSNLPVQGTAADIVKKALGLLAGRLDKDIRMVAVIHDEILLECPEPKASDTALLLKQTMEEAANSILPLVPANVDVTIAKSWADK